MSQRYIKVAYRMFTCTAASHKLLYETEATKPVGFVTGMGLMIDAFEQRLTQLREGEQFDFTLSAAEAFAGPADSAAAGDSAAASPPSEVLRL